MRITSIKLIAFLLLIAGQAWAQNFEGTIKYAMNINLPEKQRKEMEQMGYAMMMPTGFEITTKNSLSRMKMHNAGGVMMEIVSEHDKKENYMLDHKGKKAYKLPEESQTSTSKAKPKVTKTGETQTIAGYKCTKYLVEESNGKAVQQIWASKDLKIPAGAFSRGIAGKGGQALFIEGVDGLPLKMVVTENGTTSEVVATAVSKAKITDADLQVPSGYAIEPFDPAVIGRMMMGK